MAQHCRKKLTFLCTLLPPLNVYITYRRPILELPKKCRISNYLPRTFQLTGPSLTPESLYYYLLIYPYRGLIQDRVKLCMKIFKGWTIFWSLLPALYHNVIPKEDAQKTEKKNSCSHIGKNLEMKVLVWESTLNPISVSNKHNKILYFKKRRLHVALRQAWI